MINRLGDRADSAVIWRRSTVLLAVLLLAGALLLTLRSFPTMAQGPVSVPPPAVDEPAGQQATSPEVAVLAGGCFWGVQGVFQHVDGVLDAVSGYTGGAKATAQYETVSTGTTGHAESVQITYDPRRISYGHLLQIYFSVVQDPTELNRQGPDTGTQYRSTIFPLNPQQARIAKAYIAQLNAAHVFHAPIVTTIEPGRTFYPAENYHQNFLTLHPRYPYIVINDLPKVANLKRLFPTLYRANPVLVATGGYSAAVAAQ
jgi:peptide-methionine (S)-S-oxide reductase